MPYSKSFPKTPDKTVYPKWEEVYLSDEEEKDIESSCRDENIKLMRECVQDAKKLFREEALKDFQSDIIQTAIALFEKRSSHAIYWKEQAAKEKFDQSHK